MSRIFSKAKHSGFTLVEVIVVLVVLAILLAILVPSMVGWIAKAKEKQVQVELRTVALAIQSAQAETYGEMGYAVQTSSSLSEPFTYSSRSGFTPSKWDARFLTHFKEYLNDDTLFSRIPSIYAYPDGSFYFSYKVSGKTYYYAKPADGDVTVTTY